MKRPCLGIRWAQRAILFIGLHWDWVNHPPALSAFSVPFTLGPRPGATVSVEREQWKGLVSQNRSRRLDPPGELGLRCGQYPQSAFQCTKVDTQIEHMQSDLHLSHTTSPTTTDTVTSQTRSDYAEGSYTTTPGKATYKSHRPHTTLPGHIQVMPGVPPNSQL